MSSAHASTSCPRLNKLDQVMDKAMTKAMSPLTSPAYAACFQDDEARATGLEVCDQIQSLWKKNSLGEFERLKQEFGVEEKLVRLQSLIDAQGGMKRICKDLERTGAGTDGSSPSQVLEARIRAEKEAEVEALCRLAEEAEGEALELARRLQVLGQQRDDFAQQFHALGGQWMKASSVASSWDDSEPMQWLAEKDVPQ